MAALTAANVAVSVANRRRDMLPGADVKMVQAQIAFGDAALTYPANGVPLPAIGHFGLVRGIDAMFIQQPPDLAAYRYDPANGTIRIVDLAALEGPAELGPAAAPAATVLQVLIVGQ